MHLVLQKIKIFFSGNKISILILTIAIICRIVQLVFFYNIGEDIAYQTLATQNLANGNGITLAKSLPGDLSVTIYEPLIKWPPGYSLLLYPFYILFHGNYAAAGLTIDILAAILLILFCRRSLILLETEKYLVNIYTLVIAFFIYPFYPVASSDGITISLFMIAFYYTIKMIRAGKISFSFLLIISLTLLFCGLLKYLFIPAVFVIPVFLIIKGIVDKKTEWRYGGLICTTILIVGIGLMLLYQKNASGSVAYVRTPGIGFYPEHILSTYPFIPASFTKPETISIMLGQPNIANDIYSFFQYINVLLAGIILFYFIRSLLNKKFKQSDWTTNFYYLVVLLSITILFTLLILSLMIATDKISSGWWTFLQDARYFGLVIILVQLSVFIFYRKNYRSVWIVKLIPLIFLLFIPELFRGMVFTVNRVKNFKAEEYSWQHDLRFQKYAEAIIENVKQKNAIDRIVLTGSEFLNNRVTLQTGLPRLYEDSLINDLTKLHSKKPVILLAILKDEALEKFSAFRISPGVELAGRFENYSFFSYRIEAGNQSQLR